MVKPDTTKTEIWGGAKKEQDGGREEEDRQNCDCILCLG